MAISKRLRFEIFRRDGYACVYCGRRGKGPLNEDGDPGEPLEQWVQFMEENGVDEWPDELPRCLLGPRGRHHVNLNWDWQAAAAELPTGRYKLPSMLQTLAMAEGFNTIDAL